MKKEAETVAVFPMWSLEGGNTPSGTLEGDGKGGVKPGSLVVDAVPTEGSDNPVKSGGVYAALENKADKADAVLSPIYSQTPTFSEWTFSDVVPAGAIAGQPEYMIEGWWLVPLDGTVASTTLASVLAPENALSLQFDAVVDGGRIAFTATRAITNLTGYRLGPSDGPNADKLLATVEQGAKADTAYQKPSGGIPATDMASAVQDSLQKADNALSRQEAEKGFTEWVCDPATYNGLDLSIVFSPLDELYRLFAGDSPIGSVGGIGQETNLLFHAEVDWPGTVDLTATRTRLPTMADVVLTQVSVTNNSGWEFTYSGTITVDSEVVTPDTVSMEGPDSSDRYAYSLLDAEGQTLDTVTDDIGLDSVTFTVSGVTVVASRVATSSPAYQLGDQSDKPLQPAGVYLEKQLDSSGNRTAITMGTRASGYSVGESSVSEGTGTAATGVNAHSEGLNTKALANAAHSEGNSTSANAAVAHVEGDNTIAINRAEHAEGVFNKSNTGTRHSIGIGTPQSRKNALEVMFDGKAYLYGVGGYDGTNPGGNSDLKSIIDGKQNELTFDDTPLQGSTNPVRSGGIYAATTLTPIRKDGQTEPFSAWTLVDAPAGVTIGLQPEFNSVDNYWSGTVLYNGYSLQGTTTSGYTEDAVSISMDFDGIDPHQLVTIWFTRSAYPLVGYILGPDSGPNGHMPIQPQSSSMVSAEDISALQALAELDATTDLQATKNTINTLMKILKALVPAASAVFMFILSALGVDSLNNMNPTNLVYTAGEVDEYVATQALSRAEAEAGFTEWVCDPATNSLGTLWRVAWEPDIPPDFYWTLWADGWKEFYPDTFSGWGATNLEFITSESLVKATRIRLRPTPEMEESWDAKQNVSRMASRAIPSGGQLQDPFWYGSWPAIDVGNNTSKPVMLADQAYAFAMYTNLLYTKASTNDVELTPVYSDTPTFSEWTYSGESAVVEVVGQPTFYVDPNDESPYWEFSILLNGVASTASTSGGADATVLRVENQGDDSNISFTATRTRTDIIGYTLGNQTNSVLVSTNALEKYVTTNDVELVPVFTAWTILRDGVDVTAQVQQPEWLDSSDALQWLVYVLPSEFTDGPLGHNPLSISLSWIAFVTGSSEAVPYTATRSVAAYHMADQPTKDMATPDGVAKAISDAEAEARQWAELFPDGEASSIADCTQNLKFDWANADNANHTVEVLAFAADGVTPSNGDAVGDIVIPPYVETNGVRYAVTAVGAYGDQGSPSGAAITSLKAPTTVTQIGYGAFYYCSSLTSVSLPATTNIGNSAFYNCPLLTSVFLPTATAIGNSAFDSCSLLTSVSLPAATDIGIGAFYGCAALAYVDFGPDARQDAPELGEDAFPSLSGHTCRIVVPEDNYAAWVTNQNWAALMSQGYQFTKSGGTYLKDANGIYWELTVGTDGVLGATAATNIVNVASE